MHRLLAEWCPPLHTIFQPKNSWENYLGSVRMQSGVHGSLPSGTILMRWWEGTKHLLTVVRTLLGGDCRLLLLLSIFCSSKDGRRSVEEVTRCAPPSPCCEGAWRTCTFLGLQSTVGEPPVRGSTAYAVGQRERCCPVVLTCVADCLG